MVEHVWCEEHDALAVFADKEVALAFWRSLSPLDPNVDEDHRWYQKECRVVEYPVLSALPHLARMERRSWRGPGVDVTPRDAQVSATPPAAAG